MSAVAPTLPETATAIAPAELAAALGAALPRIPPLWPLRDFIAVNPYLGLTDRPFAEACELLERVMGAAPLQSAEAYRQAYRDGRIERADLEAAADRAWTVSDLIGALDDPALDDRRAPLATVADLLDQERPHAHWSVFVVDEIAKWCAVTFDENQTTWNSPWKAHGLYAGWREAALHDFNPEAFGLVGFRRLVASLPADAEAAILRCLELMAPWTGDLADFLHRQLATISGWAGYVQYLVREDAMRGRTNPALRELLAIRLAYDAALHQAFVQDSPTRAGWRHEREPRTDDRRLVILARWQRAYEAGYQRRLAQALAARGDGAPVGRPVVQAVFCIDVRSEVFRRQFEAALPGAQTIGFAGFFGFALAHQAAAGALSARCPALLVPSVATVDDLSANGIAAAGAAVAEARAWKAFQNSAASCFSFVETVGLAFGAALASRARVPRPACAAPAPAFLSASLESRVGLAAAALRAMGLVGTFARVVLICGHGGQSANNPHAAGLDCGACGGHAGDLNARLAADTFNDPAVRARLAEQGLSIPSDTYFVAGLHNTTTDDVTLFNPEAAPSSHQRELADLRRALARAGAASRRERAPRLGLGGLPDDRIDAAVRGRAVDPAQVRPEWGLANNAALVAAPRHRTAGLKLDGRVFLHDYDAAADPDSRMLEGILCAPVVVASWINLQYYASSVDPTQYGAGNKLLHNAVGGIGVVEGNGGDLKVGLPWQSIHDGRKLDHEPRRLSVYLDAEPAKISAVLSRHPEVRQLFDHGWMHLFALQGGACLHYCDAGWRQMP
jgi:uncharacterized protein YbcC (UPF0753/DUF2309 family)